MYPKLEINLNKISDNTQLLAKKFKEHNLKLIAVTKVFCANEEVAKTMVENGAEILADSRIDNLIRMKDVKAPKLLLRLPMHSEVKKVVEFADFSLNSELETIKKLSEAAKALGKKHKIVLMIDLGDLREGILPKDLDATVEEILKHDGVSLSGVGVNLTCYGGVIPDVTNLGQLAEIAEHIEKNYNVTLELISGGNSSSLYLIDRNELPKKINNLRIGETLVLGRETAYGDLVEGMHTDCFKLVAEIIELKEKGSKPIGNIGMDAFGNKPVFEDKGNLLRAIVAVGRQDVNPSGLTPFDEKIEILGASSDHLLLNLTDCDKSYKVGDLLEFQLDYGALLNLSTSEYITKECVK